MVNRDWVKRIELHEQVPGCEEQCIEVVPASDYDVLHDSYQRLTAESAEQVSLYVAVYRRAQALEAALREVLAHGLDECRCRRIARAALAPESAKEG